MTSHLMRRLLAPIACAAMLAGCLTNPLVPPSAQVGVAQGGATIDLAYNVAANAYLKALPTMSATTKAQLKPILAKAYNLVQAADAAETLGQSTAVATDIASATQLINQAKSLLGVQ